MAGKIAKREKDQSSSKTKRGVVKVPQSKDLPTGESSDLAAASSIEFWQSEISALQNEEYESMDEAIEAVVRRVVVRLLGDAKGEDDLTSFLAGVIESDPDLQEELKRSLSIKGV